MKATDRDKIINSLKTYLSTGQKFDPIDLEAWTDVLKLSQCKYDMAKAAMKQLKETFPPVDNYGKLPSIKEFRRIYNELSSPKYKQRRDCPCCNNIGFVLFKHDDEREYASDCTCYLETGLKPRTASFEKMGCNICDNILCRNPKKESRYVISPRSGYYSKNLKNCPFVETITEEK